MDQGMNALAMVRRNPIITMSVVLLAISIAMLSLPQIRWRVHVLLLHVSGKIPDIALGEVVTFMMPGSSQSMARLIETRNPHALIKNFHTSERDVAAGGRLYREQCAECHAPDGSGGPGAPSLVGREFTHGADDWAIYRSIRLGIAKTAMQPHPIGSTQLWQIVAFLRSIDTRDRGNETIAASHADLAVDLRTQIRQKLTQGQSDRQILDFMVARYGDFVLYRPPLKTTTILLWLGPFALLALALAVLAINIRRRRSAAQPAALTADENRRAKQMLADNAD